MHQYRENLLTEVSVFDGLVAFKFVQMLTKPFEKWKAFELGLIDKDGNKIKKAKTSEEKKAFGLFNRLVRNMKKFLAKLPGGSTKIGSYAAALFLLKEDMGFNDDTAKKMMDCLIEYMEENDIEPIYPDDSIKTPRMPKGRYDLDFGESVFISEDMKPFSNFLGVDLYLSETNTFGSNILFAIENIKEEF